MLKITKTLATPLKHLQPKITFVNDIRPQLVKKHRCGKKKENARSNIKTFWQTTLLIQNIPRFYVKDLHN